MERTLILGLDACFWDLLEELQDRDRIPTIESHIQNGYTAALESTVPAMTTPAWKVMYSGKNPGRLGVFGPRIGSWGGEQKVPYQYDFKSADFWDYLNDYADASVAVINGIGTYPPRELDGVMVPYTFADVDLSVYPDAYGRELEASGYLSKSYTDSEIKDGDISNVKETVRSQFETAGDRLDQDDVVALIVKPTDNVEHAFLKEGPALDLYEYIDGLLADLESEHDALNVVIISDHGMTEGPEQVLWINAWLEERGYLVETRTDVGALSADLLQKAYNLVPGPGQELLQTLLDKTGTESSVSSAVREYNVDWDASTAAYWAGGIRVEKQNDGTIERLRDEFESDFADLYPSDLTPLLRADEVYDGAYVSEAPDLVFNPYLERHLRIRQSRRQHIITDDSSVKWNHEHDPVGVLIADGPAYNQNTERAEARLVDVMPTVLASYGIEVESGIDGTVLRAALSDRETETVSELPCPERTAYLDQQAPEETEYTERAEKRLKELGYLE